MKYLLALLVAFSFPTLAADYVAHQGDDWVRITEEACKNELVLNRLEPGVAKQFRAASAYFQGQHFSACWRPAGNMAFVVYEDGDQGLVPLREFKPALDV